MNLGKPEEDGEGCEVRCAMFMGLKETSTIGQLNSNNNSLLLHVFFYLFTYSNAYLYDSHVRHDGRRGAEREMLISSVL